MWEYDSFANDFKLLCEEKKDQVMIIYDSGTKRISYSYTEVLNYAERFVTFFNDNGLQQGDTVITMLPNSPEAIICFFAALIGKINYAPLSSKASNRELNNWAKIVHPKMIIKKQQVIECDTQIRICECNCDGDLSWLPESKDFCADNISSKIYLMTSGTTGIPKAMMIDGNKLWSSAKAFTRYYEIEESCCRFWNYLPMSYIGGLYNLALVPLCCKGSFVISEPFSGKTLLNYWNIVRDYEITALWFVPSIIQGLLKLFKLAGKQEEYPYCSNVKIAFLGTAPIQLSLKEAFEKAFHIHVYENFGLSEAVVFLTVENAFNTQFREPGSVGQALPQVSLKLIPVQNMESMYEIWIKTPFLFDGYLAEDGTIEIDLDEDGYFNTKDLGYLTQQKVLVLSGRNRDIIKKGGQFIALAEIERAVGGLDFIDSVAAVPVKHDFYGETYVLCVIFKQQEDMKRKKDVLQEWMRDNFVSYKIPEKICVYESFPKTPSGKIQKNKLAEEIEKGK